MPLICIRNEALGLKMFRFAVRTGPNRGENRSIQIYGTILTACLGNYAIKIDAISLPQSENVRVIKAKKNMPALFPRWRG